MPTSTPKPVAAPERLIPDKPYTYAQVAVYLEITERQAKRYVEERWIGSVKMPRGRRILGRHITAFLEENSIDAEA